MTDRRLLTAAITRDRTCKKCGEIKPADSFRLYRKPWGSFYRHSVCVSCNKKRVERWRADRPEVSREIRSRWKRNNPKNANAHWHARRARILAAPVNDFTASDWASVQEEQAGICFYCGEPKSLTIDHKVPLSRGGAHTSANIVGACLSCNSRKWALTAEEYLAKLRVTDVA